MHKLSNREKELPKVYCLREFGQRELRKFESRSENGGIEIFPII